MVRVTTGYSSDSEDSDKDDEDDEDGEDDEVDNYGLSGNKEDHGISLG